MPSVSTGPYSAAAAITIRVRSLINDLVNDLTGDTFADLLPGTFPLLNSAYQELQEILQNGGVPAYTTNKQITVPASTSADPSCECEISFTGFFDGVSNFAAPTLPADMDGEPIRIFKRVPGSLNGFLPMKSAEDGLLYAGFGAHQHEYEWRGDSLFLNALAQPLDILIRYNGFAPPLVDATSPVLILRADEPLAYLTAARYAEARGSAAATTFRAVAKAGLDRIINRTVKSQQRVNHRRRPYRGGHRRVYAGNVGSAAYVPPVPPGPPVPPPLPTLTGTYFDFQLGFE